jgi:acetyl-CoA synthetase
MFSSPVLGSRFIIINDTGDLCPQGEVALVPPAMGLSTTLLNRDHHSCYYDEMPQGPNGEVLRRHGDEIQSLESTHVKLWVYYRALGRCDDTMNLGGIKVSSVEIERLCNTVTGVLETAAIGISPPSGGPANLIIFAVLKENHDNITQENLKISFQNIIKSKLNPLFHVGDIIITTLLPRTASNKIMRRILRDDYMKLKYGA